MLRRPDPAVVAHRPLGPQRCWAGGPLRFPAPRFVGLAGLVALSRAVLGLMAGGLPGRLLLPAHWAELRDGLDRGLAGHPGRGVALRRPRRVDSADDHARRAAAARRSPRPSPSGLPAGRPRAARRRLVLLLLYGAAVTEYDPGAPGLRGPGAAPAWWRPGCGCRAAARDRRLGAAVVVGGGGVLSCPWPRHWTASVPGGTTKPGAGSVAARS